MVIAQCTYDRTNIISDIDNIFTYKVMNMIYKDIESLAFSDSSADCAVDSGYTTQITPLDVSLYNTYTWKI